MDLSRASCQDVVSAKPGWSPACHNHFHLHQCPLSRMITRPCENDMGCRAICQVHLCISPIAPAANIWLATKYLPYAGKSDQTMSTACTSPFQMYPDPVLCPLAESAALVHTLQYLYSFRPPQTARSIQVCCHQSQRNGNSKSLFSTKGPW